MALVGGRKVREVGKTGEDGVWHGQRGGDAEHVLVLSDAGLAATGLETGPAVASGYQSKAYVTTDRPVYRPGQEVHWRAIYLQASGGNYRAPGKKRGRVSVRDARGQTLFEKDVTSSAFGTFDGAFELDGVAPLGTWTVQVSVPRSGSWTGNFDVQEFRKPEFTVALEPKQPAYLTGETVEATAHVRYAFGGPVADAPVAYEVYRNVRTFEPARAEDYAWYFKDDRRADERRRQAVRGTLVKRGTAKTDAKGDVRISFETAVGDEDAEYVVKVAVEDVTRRWIVDQGRIPVTRRGYMAVVKADRKVYRPKQEMQVEVRTVDALERPVARSGQVLLLELKRHEVAVEPPTRRRLIDGKRPVRVEDEEIQRAAYPLSTDATGSAYLRVKVPGPGRWRLRWKATDGRGGLVTAFTDVEAAGEALDLAKDARLVAARPVYTEGDAAEVLLQSPVTGVKALLTYEGEKILAYRFVDVARPSTLLALPVTGAHAPNVFFAVAIPGSGRLLQADTEVVVLRYLDVEVSLPKVAGPGKKIQVTVKTTDARGRPTPAEVGVALVDETLYAIAPDRAPAIRPFFYDRRRQNAVTTASSLGFQVTGTTRATNKDLLADEAARSGDMKKAMALSALRNAREAMARGDVRTAALLALKAAEIDPSSYEARAFVATLRESREARKVLERTDRVVLDELERSAPMEPSTARRPSATPPARLGSKVKKGEDAFFEDNEVAEEAKGVIGLGGGAGGAFRGRGGRRNLSSAGGGGRRLRQEERSFDAGNLARLQSRSGLLFDKEASDFGLGAAAGLEIRRRFADTAAWQPRLVTNARGVATFEVELPDNLTTWRALARGVSRTALVGEGRGRVVSRKDLLVRIDTPRFLVQGDALTVPVAVHNDTGAEADVRVTVTSEGVDLRGGEKTLRVADGGRAVVDTEVSAPTPGRVRFEATARAGDRGDRTEVGLGAKPRGIRVVDGRTGVLTTEGGADQQTFLDVPERAVKGATSLVVVLYPGIDDALLDALLYLDLYPYGCIEQTVNRFLPALEARKALLAAGSPDAARLKRLDEAVRRGALRLRMVQATNGSFGWFRGGHGNLAMTAYALLGYAGAREGGVKDLDLPIQRASDALRTLLKSGSEDARALAHLALATVGRADRGAYATTFRRRNDDLSVSGLAWLAVAAKRMGRSYDADELVRLLLERRVDEGTTTHWKGARESCFVGSDREATGLAAAALLLTGGGNDAVAERALAWLIANRTAGGFGSTKATAAFVQAASAWVTTHGAQGYGGTVTLALDGETVRTVKTGPEGLAAKDRRFALPEAAALAPGRHTLAFRLEGQGKLHWAVRLTSVVSSDDLPGEAHGLTVKRSFLRPEEVPLEGKPAPIKPGYSILREASRPRVEARELEVVGSGDRVLVRLEIQAPRDLQYVLIEDPLPAGFEVLDDTAQGLFDWQERRDDRQVFFCSRVPKGTLVLRYVIQATHWGSFTALGTTAAAMYLPEVHGRAAGRVLTVARGGAGGAQVEVPPTPDELYERAKRLFAAGERKESLALFRGLEKEQPLRDEIVEEIESYLLKAAIESKDAKGIVRAREALVRRNPARIGSDWETQRAIAFAYDEVGEYETAASLFRSLVARGFGLHVDWARTLIDRDRKVEGLDGLGLALRAFPVSNATAQAAFWRAQRYRDLPRPKGRALPPGQPMDEETLEALYEFTANYAETSLADPANYAIVDALRRAGDLTGAATAAEAFLARFPGSVYEDDARYFLAVSRFGTFEKAPTPEKAKAVEEAARPLVTQKFPGRDGQKRTSEFRVRALDLLARTYHVLGDLDQAVKLYWAARSLRDARESYDFLTQERLDLEPTIVLPLEGGAEVPLGYRNVGKVSFKAYPVDLQVLFAVRKTLSGLHDVDLSGIVPAHAWEIAFADAQDRLGHRRDVELPVEAGKAGAWLLVVKAGDHEAKSLVIKTDLKVVLQWIGKKLRVHVIDPAGRGVAEAYVTVSDGQRIRARGLTDGRGLFEAPGVGTGAAVVVSKDDRYAVGR
ncbi:MAG: MG2 domain-containing protein [Planctomycetota bacterium]